MNEEIMICLVFLLIMTYLLLSIKKIKRCKRNESLELAHDLRSPLYTMTTLLNKSLMADEEKEAFSLELKKIEEIANNITSNSDVLSRAKIQKDVFKGKEGINAKRLICYIGTDDELKKTIYKIASEQKTHFECFVDYENFSNFYKKNQYDYILSFSTHKIRKDEKLHETKIIKDCFILGDKKDIFDIDTEINADCVVYINQLENLVRDWFLKSEQG